MGHKCNFSKTYRGLHGLGAHRLDVEHRDGQKYWASWHRQIDWGVEIEGFLQSRTNAWWVPCYER